MKLSEEAHKLIIECLEATARATFDPKLQRDISDAISEVNSIGTY